MFCLTLFLLVSGVFADHHNSAFSFNNFTFFTNRFNGRSYFHALHLLSLYLSPHKVNLDIISQISTVVNRFLQNNSGHFFHISANKRTVFVRFNQAQTIPLYLPHMYTFFSKKRSPYTAQSISITNL